MNKNLYNQVFRLSWARNIYIYNNIFIKKLFNIIKKNFYYVCMYVCLNYLK